MGVITAASLVVASVVGFTIWGVKHHNRLNNKKLLEDAIAFLNSNPSIVSISGEKFENYNQAVDIFKNCLQLFKDGKMDELERNKFEIEICGSNIIIKNSIDDGIFKYIISKINNENYNVKKYIIRDGKEALYNDVELGVGKSKADDMVDFISEQEAMLNQNLMKLQALSGALGFNVNNPNSNEGKKK